MTDVILSTVNLGVEFQSSEIRFAALELNGRNSGQRFARFCNEHVRAVIDATRAL